MTSIFPSGAAVLTVEETRQADHLAIESGTPSILLMENAGRSVAEAVCRRFTVRPILVLCGPGSNGGDGFVAARHLAVAGWPVVVAHLPGRTSPNDDVTEAIAQWEGETAPLERQSIDALLDAAALIIDALFGAGLARPLDGAAVAILAAAAKRNIPIVAIDVPSGMHGDSGANWGAAQASLTVTFGWKKPGHLLLPGRDLCGDIVVADIGLRLDTVDKLQPRLWENGPGLWAPALPVAKAAGHKYQRGHAIIFGGYPMTGAARLAARAAARIGAGLATVAVPEIAFPIYAGALTSIMVKPLSVEQDFQALVDDVRHNAYLIGPGAGVGQETRRRALGLLSTERAVVIDADAITSLAGSLSLLKQAVRGPAVLTPHEGEFARVFEFDGDKLVRARAAAGASGAIIVLKGSDTVIAAPDGRAIINSNAPPSLATAGSGDVLSGLVLGLLSQGLEPFLAAAAAVWIHGDAASRFGLGLMAEDLPDIVPSVLNALRSRTESEGRAHL
jgi:NAD(P)H-hydrate epimerase